ncbi:unnamed protein product [Brassica oleracea]|uniref:Uncharacterized protein n=2 Tax=Brassica TaxID=3705 RepID=A0A3P6GXJ9_BRAOL|nr:unnamed protein product [Brassica napus]VDD61075.1 unnamed protein product [Brassica oleracea]
MVVHAYHINIIQDFMFVYLRSMTQYVRSDCGMADGKEEPTIMFEDEEYSAQDLHHPQIAENWRGDTRYVSCVPCVAVIVFLGGENEGSKNHFNATKKSNGGGNKRVFQRLGGSNYPKDSNQKVCFHWRAGRCNCYSCPFLYRELPGSAPFPGSSSTNNKESIMTLVVTGIALPSGSDKLYTASKDETLRIWDCASGQCTCVLNLGGEAGCMISEGPWLLVGMPNLVKSFDAYLYIQAWNIQTNVDLSLTGPVGQVYSLVVATDLLFAGTQCMYDIFDRHAMCATDNHDERLCM